MPRYAAIDIGSNSVRMLAAEVVPGSPARELATDREVTRLGASVFRQGRISEEAIAFVCQVLKRMVDAYSKLDVVGVRAVATSAVRDASNQAEFVERATAIIGAPVEIISGAEEARLIHLGVQARWPQPEETILIVDVGGGSAEFIVAENAEMKEGISRPLGAVRLNEVFLKTDPPSDVELTRLRKFIDDKFEPARERIAAYKFDRVIGTSATAAALVSAAHSIPRARREEADRVRANIGDLRKLYAQLAGSTLNERKKIGGLGPRRAEIIVAGASVFLRTLETLDQPAMYYCAAGVRDGIIADLAARGVGRERSRLTPSQLRVIEAMCRKYDVDLNNAKHASNIAAHLFDAMQPLHTLPPDIGRLLESAAYLHNVGHFISDTGHHKHSAYVVSSSDMPGYTDRERHIVALLCRYHRKSMPTPRHDLCRSLSADEKRIIQMMTPLLRLAIALDAGRAQKVQTVDMQVANVGVNVTVRGEGDYDLEIWAAERAADAFRQVYGIPMNIAKARK
ncbi:MAG TPA: Ppx/GppA phosphatase family protein [Bryobacteraceae bacterium]|nr:Ppx/GppA phosphatase family protein [Bryobacteraceae bacterium]